MCGSMERRGGGWRCVWEDEDVCGRTERCGGGWRGVWQVLCKDLRSRVDSSIKMDDAVRCRTGCVLKD